MPTTLGKTTPPGWTSPDQAKEQTDAARRRARQSIREHELIWLLQQRLRAQCLGLTGACAACSHCKVQTARPRHGSCQTLITLTRRSLSVSRALHVLSSCVLCLAPPAVDLLEALDRCVCTRRACCFCLRVYRTSTASVELRPRGWRAVAFPRCHLRDRSGSPWLIVILMVRCCFGGLCAYETGLLLVCACRTSAASVEPLPRGLRAVAFPLWLQVLSCSTWLIVRCCINSSSCVLASLALIVKV